MLSILAGLFGELVAPARCAVCDASVRANVLFCSPCAAAALPSPDPSGVFAYGGAVADAIVRFKFQGRADLAGRFARAMVPRARTFGVDVVVPVPIHPHRRAARGYNQAALLAGPIARAVEVPFAARALARVRDTPMQSALDRAARRENLTGAFRVRTPNLVRGRVVLLVDDVRTTGSTLAACTASLHEVGVRRVIPLVLACRDGLAL